MTMSRFIDRSAAVRLSWALLGLAAAAGSASAQGLAPDSALPEGGIPVESDVVVARCSGCHLRAEDGRMSRLSYIRKTPEGWQTSLRRMASLNDVDVDPETARAVVRYLSDRHGLAPEELRPVTFEVERRAIDYRYEADEETETTCKQCHSVGRAVTQRRTREEWELLVATHRGYYPLSDFQAFRRAGPAGDGEDPRHPMDKAVDHLAGAFPLETPEWSAWSATMRPPRLEGTWVLSGHDPGRGPVYGLVTIDGDGSDAAAFTTTTSLVHAASGRTVRRSGRSLVYTGFQWRGRSFEPGDRAPLREVMFVERDWRVMWGRWFTGDYDELGLDVTLRRVGGDPVVAGLYPRALRPGQTVEVRVFGANLPSDLSPAAVDLGPGVAVTGVREVRDDGATLRVAVAPDAALGSRDAFVAGVSLGEAVVVYDRVSRIAVTPQAGMARVGGANFPKQFQQFEALAFHDGADGESDTEDDLALGVVDVTWSLEEYTATFDDDDVAYVGAIDGGGLFTPAVDGPNPARAGNRNNIGDVWVVAAYDPGDGQAPLRARAHLLVTVPLYLRWEPWRTEP